MERWQPGECEVLRSCYLESLKLAQKNDCAVVAFPLISAGAYGFPEELALNVAVEAINSFPSTVEMEIYLVLYNK